MTEKEKKQFKVGVIFIVTASFLSFILISALSAVFITALPMDQDWCKSGFVENVSGAHECGVYKNNLQRLLYSHNSSMIGRLTAMRFWIMAVVLIAALLVTYKWIKPDKDGEGVAIALGMTIFVFAGIIVVQWVLPPPVYWFPEVFSQVNQNNQDSMMRQIIELDKLTR